MKEPYLRDNKLIERAIGLFEGEGSSSCVKGKLRIGISMCSKDALERIAPVFGTKVTKSNKETCDRTFKNPEGYSYRLAREGRFAAVIMSEFIRRGLSAEKTGQYANALRECKTKRGTRKVSR